MDPRATNVTIVVDGGRDALPEDIDSLTRRLRSEIQDFGVENVTLRRPRALRRQVRNPSKPSRSARWR